MKMNEFLGILLETSLAPDSVTEEKTLSASRRLPKMISAKGTKIPIYSNSDLFGVLDRVASANP